MAIILEMDDGDHVVHVRLGLEGVNAVSGLRLESDDDLMCQGGSLRVVKR